MAHFIRWIWSGRGYEDQQRDQSQKPYQHEAVQCGSGDSFQGRKGLPLQKQRHSSS